MKKILSLLFLLTSCTSVQNPQTVAQEPVKEPEIIENDRYLASVEEDSADKKELTPEERFKKYYTDETDVNKIVKTMKNSLIKRYRIYVRADKKVKAFDNELADFRGSDVVSPLSTETYKDLIALRILTEEIVDEVVYFYSHLHEIISSTTNASERAKAQYVQQKFIAFLKSPENREALILLDDSAFRIANEKLVEKGLVNDAELLNKMRAKLSQKKYDQLTVPNDEIEQKINQEIEEIKSKLATDLVFDDRNPNSYSGKTPSTGPEGNFTGREPVFAEGTWALTYDDGPSAKRTTEVLNNLEKNNVKATFFWLTQNLNANKTLIAKAKQMGMSLNSHSYTHANIPKLSDSGKEKEITQAVTDAIPLVGNMKFFRLPYGSGLKDQSVREKIAKKNLIHVFWNVDSLDWQDKDPNLVLKRTLEQIRTQKRGIVLFHDIHPQSVEASRMLMEQGAKNGIKKWVTMDEVLNATTPL